MPRRVLSPKQLPVGTSFTVPRPAIWMATLPCSSTKSVPAVPPCCKTVSPAKSKRRSPLLATSFTKPKSHPKKRFSELATSVLVSNRSLMHSAVSTKRSVDGCKSVGYAASTFKMERPGKKMTSTSVLARTVAGRGRDAPIRLMSPMMAPPRRRPTVCCSAWPSSSLTFFSTEATPLTTSTRASESSPAAPSATTSWPLGTRALRDSAAS
mmetsp:Transcript_129729/g.307763  ORF Transcript_129729/g.307763 Transcript_129729/m.307763 type:complete len:210 (-) Transcript_129729:1139-1768(-)